jgi:hypothetical protein
MFFFSPIIVMHMTKGRFYGLEIIASAQVGKPHFWTTQPTVGEFALAYTGGSVNIAFTLFLLCLAAGDISLA